jgi:hypothetical protein
MPDDLSDFFELDDAPGGPAADAPAREPDMRCAVIGLTGAGKTTLLFALNQACLDQGGDEFDLDFIPDDPQTIALMRSASDFIFRGTPIIATNEVTSYNFRVFAQDRRSTRKDPPCLMSVIDGQGGHLFTPGMAANERLPGWEKLVEQARVSECLLLCADASTLSLEELYHGLPDMLRAFRGHHRKLPHRRVLLLLTKIDIVIHEFLASTRLWARARNARGHRPSRALDLFAGGVSRGRNWPGMRTETIARSISPLGHARVHLGKIVSLLQASVESDAVFATGVCSAYGLTGPPEHDDIRSAQQRLAAWTPFGVREALLFLAAGDIRHPIERVPRRGDEYSLPLRPVPLWPE